MIDFNKLLTSAGRRFYPTPHARRELAEIVHEACTAGWAATR